MNKAIGTLRKLTSLENLTMQEEVKKLQKENVKLMEENMKLENKVEELTSRFEELARQLSEIKNVTHLPQSQEETLTTGLPSPNEILPRESHLLIRELLMEIREFDGNSDVQAFIDQIITVRKQLQDDRAIESLIRKVIACKIKGRAQEVVERNDIKNLVQLKECLNTHFGQIELEYEQLAEIRNAIRHRTHETVKDYIRRFDKINRRIQRAIDGSDEEFKVMRRAYENKYAISKFINGLYPTELKLSVQNRRPHTLPVAYQAAQHEDKLIKDDASLRARQNSGSSRREHYTSRRDNYSSSKERSYSRDRYRDDRSQSREKNEERRIRDATPASRNVSFEGQVNRKDKKPTCTHCGLYGHDRGNCYRLKNSQSRENFRKPASEKTYLTDPDEDQWSQEEEEKYQMPSSHPQEDIGTFGSNRVEYEIDEC